MTIRIRISNKYENMIKIDLARNTYYNLSLQFIVIVLKNPFGSFKHKQLNVEL